MYIHVSALQGNVLCNLIVIFTLQLGCLALSMVFSHLENAIQTLQVQLLFLLQLRQHTRVVVDEVDTKGKHLNKQGIQQYTQEMTQANIKWSGKLT